MIREKYHDLDSQLEQLGLASDLARLPLSPLDVEKLKAITASRKTGHRKLFTVLLVAAIILNLLMFEDMSNFGMPWYGPLVSAFLLIAHWFVASPAAYHPDAMRKIRLKGEILQPLKKRTTLTSTYQLKAVRNMVLRIGSQSVYLAPEDRHIGFLHPRNAEMDLLGTLKQGDKVDIDIAPRTGIILSAQD